MKQALSLLALTLNLVMGETTVAAPTSTTPLIATNDEQVDI